MYLSFLSMRQQQQQQQYRPERYVQDRHALTTPVSGRSLDCNAAAPLICFAAWATLTFNSFSYYVPVVGST